LVNYCCAIETRKRIIEEFGDEPYAILADESSDISHKEQLTLGLHMWINWEGHVSILFGVKFTGGT
jgi:hypothetical protein